MASKFSEPMQLRRPHNHRLILDALADGPMEELILFQHFLDRGKYLKKEGKLLFRNTRNVFLSTLGELKAAHLIYRSGYVVKDCEAIGILWSLLKEKWKTKRGNMLICRLVYENIHLDENNQPLPNDGEDD